MGSAKEVPLVDLTSSADELERPRRMELHEAMDYLDSVKSKFKNNPTAYSEFLGIMQGFQTHSLDTADVIESVANLFWNSPDLIKGFNSFLPPGYRIEISTNNNRFLRPRPPVQSTIPIIVLSSGESSQEELSRPGKSIPVIEMTYRKSSTGAPVVSSLAPTAGTESTSNKREVVTPRLFNFVNPAPPLKRRNAAVISPSTPCPPPSNPVEYAKTKPVEFNNAINYVNKIKRRFHDEPHIYREFLTILNSYQKNLEELNEEDVFSKVAKLFCNHEDLLKEFAIFLPEASNYHFAKEMNSMKLTRSCKAKPLFEVKMAAPSIAASVSSQKRTSVICGPQVNAADNIGHNSTTKQAASKRMKRSTSPKVKTGDSSSGQTATTKQRKLSPSEINNMEVDDFSPTPEFLDIFQSMRRSLPTNEVYENFVRVFVLFNDDVVCRAELVNLTHPFLKRQPDLLHRFTQFLGLPHLFGDDALSPQDDDSDSVKGRRQNKKRTEIPVNIDFSHCKRVGTNYCVMPKSYVPPKCSARTELCNEVLNDELISSPFWPQDDRVTPTNRSEIEEHMFCIEDQRFELDMVIDTNLSLIKLLESHERRISRMSFEDQEKFKLDDTLGGGSSAINLVAIKRLYGSSAPLILEGLMKRPVQCIPIVLKRLKSKDREWRDAQKEFNKYWRKQDQDFYSKVLQHPPVEFDEYYRNESSNAETFADEIPAGAIDDVKCAEVDVQTEQNI